MDVCNCTSVLSIFDELSKTVESPSGHPSHFEKRSYGGGSGKI